MNEKIKQAIKKGDLISYNKIFTSLPKKRQAAILKRTRYIQAAMALRKLRKALHLSQEKLAEKMKVKREFISRIESGEQNVTIETLYKIAEATGKEFSFCFR
ncbi:helix-turn-helix transcriptional regulator [Candidatus Microgenomates bacterium]|nr:helix-turn-helix transcriptional regulator [Candidatus Microgenomates bacterium]